jgi:hypothetical protein
VRDSSFLDEFFTRRATRLLEQVVTPDEYLNLSTRLAEEAKAMEERIIGGSFEEWSALKCIQDASHVLFSAYAWLSRVQEEGL